MQFVPGFSSAQTVPAAPASTAAGRKPSLWILDSWRDLILYVCTPLLLVPIFVAAQGLWSAEDIYLFVAAFGAMGHYPKLAQPHNYLGKVLMCEGSVSQAIAQFEEALRLHSDFPEAEENLRLAGETSVQSP